MKRISFVLTSALVLFLSTQADAQKVKLRSGNTDMLSGTEKINLVYVYDGMTVEKYKSEEEYIAKKKGDYNKKEAGKGDDWEKAWVADRKNRFQPQFEELFDKTSGVDGGDYPDAKYTIIFKTTHTEGGYNIHISRKNAEIDGEALLVETANQDKVLAKISVDNAPGRTFGGYDYDSGTRIQEAYATAGKALGKFLKKSFK